MAKKKKRITEIRHPNYLTDWENFEKWRLCYKAGDQFIYRYLEKFSTREHDENFLLRKKVAYAPALAKAAINEIRNSIYQRMSEISRVGGSQDYQDAIVGLKAGVDLHGNSMNAYIGQDVLTELMIMGKVGVLIDRQPIIDPRIDLNKGNKPYLYYYAREDILSWNSTTYFDGNEIFTNLLLRTRVMVNDDEYNLTCDYREVYRHFFLNEEGKVEVNDWIDYKDEDNETQSKIVANYKTDLYMIPFALADIGASLMEDIGNYQIGLLNLASSDLAYALRSNFVFLTEQYDPASEQTYTRRIAMSKVDPANPLVDRNKLDAAQQGTGALGTSSSSQEEVMIGGAYGRRYPKNMNPPQFISPSPEPLKASMEKQSQMKAELREIINLSISNVAPQHASAESKKEDQSGLQNGLSGIGLELEYLERQIAKIWAMYENSKEVAEVTYPRKYDIKSDADRQSEANALKGLKGAAPSRTFAKEIGKQIADKMLSGKVSAKTLNKIMNEIDAAEYITSDAQEITLDVQAGLVSKETASDARGYDGKKEIPVAEAEYTKRMAEIAASQSTGARGGAQHDPNAAKLEKTKSQNPDMNPTSGGSQTRGDGK